jgi:hypothetical protein
MDRGDIRVQTTPLYSKKRRGPQRLFSDERREIVKAATDLWRNGADFAGGRWDLVSGEQVQLADGIAFSGRARAYPWRTTLMWVWNRSIHHPLPVFPLIWPTLKTETATGETVPKWPFVERV